MTLRLEPYVPPDATGKEQDPVTRELMVPRRTTTDEQEAAALEHALTAMLEAGDWTAELVVHWTRREPTVLVVAGHAEHLGRRRVPVLDAVDERTLEGDPVPRTPADRFRRLEAELEDAWDDGL